MKTMRALEVGDRVKTKAFKDYDGNERFPVGTIAIVTQIDCTQKYSIRVSTNDDWWWYSADELELISELSAAEVLKICNEICATREGGNCSVCKMHHNCFFDLSSDYQKVVEICEQWKANHEKKEPEFEWVDVCRIIEVQDNGFKKCVHEEDIEAALNLGGDIKAKTEEILKRYIKEHDGVFFATVERACRVKQ